MSFHTPGSVARTLALLAALCVGASAQAHEGHDDDGGAPEPVAAPGRQSDGSVVLPLAQQTGILIQEYRGKSGVDRAIAARVIADPSLSAQLRAPRSGELVAPDHGFPTPGQRLEKGALIAWMKPAFDRAQRSDLRSELARIETDLLLAKQKLQQYSVGIVGGSSLGMSPQFMQLKADVESSEKKRDEYKAGLSRRIPLRAPMAGVLSRSELSTGRVVRAGDMLGELIEPDRLWLYALNADTHQAPPKRAVGVTTDGRRVDLELVGMSRRLVGQSVPMQYRIVNPPKGLAVGQAMTLLLGTPELPQIPADALVGSGPEARAWVQLAADRFVLKPAVALRAGDRMVVRSNARLRALQTR